MVFKVRVRPSHARGGECLAPCAHENDAYGAFNAAVRLVGRQRPLGLKCSPSPRDANKLWEGRSRERA